VPAKLFQSEADRECVVVSVSLLFLFPRYAYSHLAADGYSSASKTLSVVRESDRIATLSMQPQVLEDKIVC
jgi:hypothetical protein